VGLAAVAADLPSLKVGLPSLSMYSVIEHVAQDKGFFDREGVKVELNHFESGSTNMKALLGRAIDVADVETGLILGAAASGADLRVIGTQCQGLHFALYTKNDINSLKDLYGRTFAISGIGGLPHLVMLALFERQQLDASKVQLLVVGGTAARLKSLAAGKVDATLGEFSPTIEAEPGLHRLMIVSKVLPLYMSQGLAVWADTATSKRDALERWQRALVKATRWAYDNKAEFIAAAQKHLPTSAEELGKIYDSYIEARVWAINGELDPTRLAYMQDLGLKTNTQAKPVNLETLADPQLTSHAIQSIGLRDYPAR
jgi:NitT/TauT family transport system substrate-binding protein